MKGQGKSTPRWNSPDNRTPGMISNRRCVKVGCGEYFRIASYKIRSEDYLCPKHREEFHQQEAEQLLLEEILNKEMVI